MAIGQVVTNVIKDVLEDYSLQENDIRLSCDDERKRLVIDRSDFKPWHNDTFNSSCTNIARRFTKISERFAKYTSADILACIKFESANQETNGGRPNSKYSRRLQFSTGASISLDNLIKCSSDHQIETPTDDRKYGTECNVFPDTGLISVSPHKHSTGTENVTPVVDGGRSRIPGSPWQENVCQYDNPFDPRLGLVHLVREDNIDTENEEIETSVPETFNCLIESDHPTEFTNNYLNAFRAFHHNLVAETKCRSTSETTLSLECNTNRDQNDDQVPTFVGEDRESRVLWDRVHGTKDIWDTGSPQWTVVNIDENESTIYDAYSASNESFQSPCYNWGNVDYSVSPKQRNSGRSLQDSTSNEAAPCGQQDASDRSSLTEEATPLFYKTWKPRGGGTQKTRNNIDTLSTLNNIAEYVTKSSISQNVRDGGVQTVLQSNTCENTVECLSNWADDKQTLNGSPRKGYITKETNERSRPFEPMRQPQKIQSADVTVLHYDKVCKPTTLTSASDVPKDHNRPVVNVEPIIRSAQDKVEDIHFPHQSSVFWANNHGQVQFQSHSSLPIQAGFQNCPLNPPQVLSRQSQQWQRPPVQQNHQAMHQQGRQPAPLLVQNQYGLYVNQSQQQNQFRQFVTPSGLQNHQVTTAHTQNNTQIPYTNVHQGNGFNGTNTQGNQYRQRPMAVDDEVWYINGVPHYHARSLNQHENTAQRFPVRQEPSTIMSNSNQPRPWSVTGSNSEIRQFIPPDMTRLPPPPQQQTVLPQFQPNVHAQQNINMHNPRSLPPLGRIDCVNPFLLNGNMPLNLNVITNNRNNNNNSQSEDTLSNQSTDGSHSSSPAECPRYEGAQASSNKNVVKYDITTASKKLDGHKRERFITVIGTHGRCDDEMRVKKRKHRKARCGLLRIV